MPELAVGDLRVLVCVDHEDLGMTLHMRRGRVEMQRAEALAERHVLFRGHRPLVAEEDHRVFVERVEDLVPLIVGQRLRKVHAANLGADDRRAGRDLNGSIVHGS